VFPPVPKTIITLLLQAFSTTVVVVVVVAAAVAINNHHPNHRDSNRRNLTCTGTLFQIRCNSEVQTRQVLTPCGLIRIRVPPLLRLLYHRTAAVAVAVAVINFLLLPPASSNNNNSRHHLMEASSLRPTTILSNKQPTHLRQGPLPIVTVKTLHTSSSSKSLAATTLLDTLPKQPVSYSSKSMERNHTR
jgi:hypothetical protein